MVIGMAKKILKLDFTEEYGFTLFALVCSLKDFKLCFELNQLLDFNFRRKDNVEITDKQRNRHTFTNFYFADRHAAQFHLISNRCNNGFFIPEKKNIDFFLMIKDCSRQVAREIFLKIKKSEVISGIYEFNPAELKSTEHFLYFE